MAAMPNTEVSASSNPIKLTYYSGLKTVLLAGATHLTAAPWLRLLVGAAMLCAILIPLNLLTSQPFHHDEALYGIWALEIVSGDNPLLAQTPIDKPPLFLYTVAGAMRVLGAAETVARLPSLLATALSVGLTFLLGQKLYSRGVGLLAAWLVALSPFTILFAPTAFTDPLLVGWVLAACLVAAQGRARWSGFWLGLAVATKQQGIFFIPLAMALLLNSHLTEQPVKNIPKQATRFIRPLLRMILVLALTLLPVFIWDGLRAQSPGFWRQSLVNYGGLAGEGAGFSERWTGFVALLEYGTASPLLNTVFIIGLPLLILYGAWRKSNEAWRVDWIISLFILAFLFGHAWVSFQVWDRYLLGLIPFLALLMARILLWPYAVLQKQWLNQRPTLRPVGDIIVVLVMGGLLMLTLARPVQDAANARYPLGSNSNALRGISQITAYLQGNTGANSTLYHRWLGAHWRFYLWDYPYDLQFWDSPQLLAAKAQPGHLIAFPSWQSDTEARLALAGVGLELEALAYAYTPAGYPSIILYQIKAR